MVHVRTPCQLILLFVMFKFGKTALTLNFIGNVPVLLLTSTWARNVFWSSGNSGGERIMLQLCSWRWI